MNENKVWVEMRVNMPAQEYLEFLMINQKFFLKDSYTGNISLSISNAIDIINSYTDISQEEKNLLIAQFVKFAWEFQKAHPRWLLTNVLGKGMQYIPEDEVLKYLANLVNITNSRNSSEVKHLKLWYDTLVRIKNKPLLKGYSKILQDSNNNALTNIVLLEAQATYDVATGVINTSETEYQRYVRDTFQLGDIKLSFTTKQFGFPSYFPCQFGTPHAPRFGYPNTQYYIDYAKVLGVSIQGYFDKPTFSVQLPIVLFDALPSLMQPIINGLQKDWETQRDSICAHIGITPSEFEMLIFEWVGVENTIEDFIDKLYAKYDSSGVYLDKTFLEWIGKQTSRLQTPLDKQKWICWQYENADEDEDE